MALVVLIRIATHWNIYLVGQPSESKEKYTNILVWWGLGTSALIGDTFGNLVGDLSRAPHATEPHRCSVVLDHKIQPTSFKLSFFQFLSPYQLPNNQYSSPQRNHTTYNYIAQKERQRDGGQKYQLRGLTFLLCLSQALTVNWSFSRCWLPIYQPLPHIS